MIRIKAETLAIGLLATLCATAAVARDAVVGRLLVQQPWARETATGQAVGGGFMSIVNSGATADRLMTASSPVAASVQIHAMTMDGNVMRMRQVPDGLVVPAKGALVLKPGSYHLMFMGLKQPLRRGQQFPVTLNFQKSGRVTVQFSVQPAASLGPAGEGHG